MLKKWVLVSFTVAGLLLLAGYLFGPPPTQDSSASPSGKAAGQQRDQQQLSSVRSRAPQPGGAIYPIEASTQSLQDEAEAPPLAEPEFLAALEAFYASEPEAPTSAEIESALTSLISELAIPTLQVVSAECKDTLCRFEFTCGSVDDRENIIYPMSTRAPFRQHIRVFHLESSPDSQHTLVFFTREGYGILGSGVTAALPGPAGT